jgi:hypothetical protein
MKNIDKLAILGSKQDTDDVFEFNFFNQCKKRPS